MMAVKASGKSFLVFFKLSSALACSVVKCPIREFSNLDRAFLFVFKDDVLYKLSATCSGLYEPVKVQAGNVVEGEWRGARIVHDECSANALRRQYLALSHDIREISQDCKELEKVEYFPGGFLTDEETLEVLANYYSKH